MSPMNNDEYAAIADLYDHITIYNDRFDVAFFVEAAKESRGPVLEIGCGTGRVLIPIAREGIDIVGLDPSPSMLAICRQRLEQESAEVRSHVELVEGDMRAFDLGRTFRLVTLPFRPFQHLLTLDDELTALATIRRCMTDDGRLILDLFNPDLAALALRWEGEEREEGAAFTTPDGRRVVRRFRIGSHDRFQQIMRLEIIHDVTHPDGREEQCVQPMALRYLFRFEAEHLLARAGFTVERLYAGYDKSEYGSSYPGELVFVARKARGSGWE